MTTRIEIIHGVEWLYDKAEYYGAEKMSTDGLAKLLKMTSRVPVLIDADAESFHELIYTAKDRYKKSHAEDPYRVDVHGWVHDNGIFETRYHDKTYPILSTRIADTMVHVYRYGIVLFANVDTGEYSIHHFLKGAIPLGSPAHYRALTRNKYRVERKY